MSSLLTLKTTGVDKIAEIIQIGILGFENGEPIERLSTLVRPSQPIPIPVTNLTGISSFQTDSANPFTDHYESMNTLIQGKTIVAYNADFDKRMYLQTCNRYKLGAMKVTWHCAMKKYAEFYGQRTTRAQWL